RVPPFDHLGVRQAFNLAVDRERLRDLVVGPGLGHVTCQVLPPNFVGYRPYCPYTANPSPSGAWTATDLSRARELVRRSGTAGQAVTVWLPDWMQVSTAAGRYVVSVLDSLGYRAHMRRHENPYPLEDRLRIQVGFAPWAADFTAPAGFFVQELTCDSYIRNNA